MGVISDSEAQPILITAHMGRFAVATVSRIVNIAELEKRCLDQRRTFSELSRGAINPTELVAMLIAEGDTIAEGIENVYRLVKGSCSMLVLSEDCIIAARDRLGRTPIVIGKKPGAYAAAFETCALKTNHDVWTEIRYLQKHGSEGHLQYSTFRRRGIPCGSGAIESTIRRVINLRLKSNGMYWLEENAEAMFTIRALILSERWDDTLSRVRQTRACDRRINWRWTAPDLTTLNTDEPGLPPSPQPSVTDEHTTLAA